MNLVFPKVQVEDIDASYILKKIEKCGRVCYKSEDKIADTSAAKFCKRLLSMNPPHLSVFEHVNITVHYILNRGVSHELVRHRLSSYSQESTRYCDYKGGVSFIIPHWININEEMYNVNCDDVIYGKNTHKILSAADCTWIRSMDNSEYEYKNLLGLGWTPQQARDVLPNALKTEVYHTANLREWMHIFNLRCSHRAHPQMIEVMQQVQTIFHKKLPEIFDEPSKNCVGKMGKPNI